MLKVRIVNYEWRVAEESHQGLTNFQKAREYLIEAKNSLDFAQSALDDMQIKPSQAVDLHRRWREYLANWSRSWDFIRKAAEHSSNKKLADSMKNRHKKHSVARDLFQSRDSDTHVGKVVDATPTSINIAGVLGIQSDNTGQIIFKDNYVIGPDGVRHTMPNFYGSVTRGEVKAVISQSENVFISNAYLKLLPATNRSGTYAVPRTEISDENRAVVIAKDGVRFLYETYAEVYDEIGEKE